VLRVAFRYHVKKTLKEAAGYLTPYPTNVDKVDLKSLRYLIAVAEAGSFSRAAERLNVAQSHLSRQIMRRYGAQRFRRVSATFSTMGLNWDTFAHFLFFERKRYGAIDTPKKPVAN
jgi:hypothetical protein